MTMVLEVAHPDATVPLESFIERLMNAINEQFGYNVCEEATSRPVDMNIGSDDDIVDVDDLINTVPLVSNRTLWLAFFGFTLLFECDPIESLPSKVPPISEIGSVECIADRFILLVGEHAGVAIDAQGRWRTDRKISVHVAKLLPEFLLAFSQAGDDESQLAKPYTDDDQRRIQIGPPSFLEENHHLVWEERWRRLSCDPIIQVALANALIRVPAHRAVYAMMMIMRFATHIEVLTLEEFNAIATIVVDRCSDTADASELN